MSNQDPPKKKSFSFNLQKALDDEECDETIIELKTKTIKVNYYQLCKYSKLIRKEYNQDIFKNRLLEDIQRFQQEYDIDEQNIVLFFQLLQEENVEIQNEQYLDLCILSKLYKVNSLAKVLDDYSEKHINDIDFAINLLLNEPRSNKIRDIFPYGEMHGQLEEILANHVNECIQNENFGKLPISSIYRVIEKSDKKQISYDLLYEFIAKSIESRSPLFSFIKFQNLSENIFNKLYSDYISRSDSESFYYQYLPSNLEYIKQLKEKSYRDSIEIKAKLRLDLHKKEKENSELLEKEKNYTKILEMVLLNPDQKFEELFEDVFFISFLIKQFYNGHANMDMKIL